MDSKMQELPSRWELIHLFSEEITKSYLETYGKNQNLERLIDNSLYRGQRDEVGMYGAGWFKMPHEVVYEGRLKHNAFHGAGKLLYPNRTKFLGEWKDGHMISHQYYFKDGAYKPDYCKMPDRRFSREIKCGLQPAGRSYMTQHHPVRKIPPHCYDAGDGFYNPKTKCVADYNDSLKIVRIPTRSQHDWILSNCRKSWDEPVGYRPDLYENWNDTCTLCCICPQLAL